NVDLKFSRQTETTIVNLANADFCGYRSFTGSYLCKSAYLFQRAVKTGRITCGKQHLRISIIIIGASQGLWHADLHINQSVVTFYMAIAAAGSSYACGVQCFHIYFCIWLMILLSVAFNALSSFSSTSIFSSILAGISMAFA